MGHKKRRIFFDEFYDEFEFERALSAALKTEREKQGLSQRDLAQKIGITQSSLARFERERAGNPTIAFLKKIILGLGLKLTVVKDETMI